MGKGDGRFPGAVDDLKGDGVWVGTSEPSDVEVQGCI